MELGVCPPLPGNTSSAEEIRLLDSEKIRADEKLAIRRAFRNLSPESTSLRVCVDAAARKLFYDIDCSLARSRPNSNCNCSTNSDLSKFCDCKAPTPRFTEADLQFFVNVICSTAQKELIRRAKDLGLRQCKKRIPEYAVYSLKIVDSRSNSSGSSSSSLEYDPCDCVGGSLECWEYLAAYGSCKPRSDPIRFRHLADLLLSSSSSSGPNLESSDKPFRLGSSGCSEEVGKWGRFYELVERVLREIGLQEQQQRRRFSCCSTVCRVPARREPFEDVHRFRDLEDARFSTFCRNLLRWSSCTTKRWNCITRASHVVVHLPSMSYPCHLRGTAHKQFVSLQNAQIGRLGWLVNKNAQVIYVCPGKSNFKTECNLKNFVKLARPDVEQSNLWIIVNDEECLCCDVEEEYRSGCENLFYTPSVYRRLRNLSAGRHGFIIPGVLCKTDVFIACELRMAIIGPCLKFQERLLNKHYVMAFLKDSGVHHPPFAGIRNFVDLCETMARMIIGLPWRAGTRNWLLKVNCGFCGKQSALISLDCDECQAYNKEFLHCYLMDVLPQKLKVNKKAYKEAKDFFVELERHGGVLTVCPDGECRTVSLGCFIEHDTAEACLRTAADVVQTCSDCGWTDVGYIIPQTTLPLTDLQLLVSDLGKALLIEQYTGYYGLDLVVFTDEQDHKKLHYWVVDVDPYYTDLLSFDDWRRFCLNVPQSARFFLDPSCKKYNEKQKDKRYVVCSGKLYNEGLSQISENGGLEDLWKKHNIAYSSKARTGCMACPIDNEQRAFLLFAFCRARKMALGYFVHALRVLHRAAAAAATLDKHSRPPLPSSPDNCLNSLANSISQSYGIGF